MKLSNSRAVFPVKRPTQKLRNTYSPSSLHTRAKHWIRRDSAQKLCAPDRILYCAAHRRQRHRNRGDVRTYSRQQRQRQYRRSRQNRRRNVPPQLCQHGKTCRVKICNLRANAQTILVPVWKHAQHKAHQRPHRRNRDDVHTFSKQQRQRQHHRHLHRNNRKIITPHQRFRRRKMYRTRIYNPCANARKIFAPVQNHAHHKAHQRPRRRNRGGVHTYSRQQRQRQHRQSRQNRRRNILPQLCRHWKMCRGRFRKHPVSAQTIYDCALSQMHHSTLHPQHHKSLGGVHLYGRQRNPTQKKRPRRIFIQSHQKFVLRKIFPSVNRRASVKSQRSRSCVTRCRLSRRQRKHRTFGISSRLVHGRRATLSLLTVR